MSGVAISRPKRAARSVAFDGASNTLPIARARKTGLSIHKFGGAALADAGAIRTAVTLLLRERAHDDASRENGRARRSARPTLVVASALSGVTDVLLGIARTSADVPRDLVDAEIGAIRQRHLQVIDALLQGSRAEALRTTVEQSFSELETIVGATRLMGVAGTRECDLIVARGERLSAQILVAALQDAGVSATFVDATSVIVTDGRFGEGAPDLAGTTAAALTRLQPLLRSGVVPVVPGFLGGGPDGQTVTLGRGGSDLTATLLARALGAASVVLWKDVPGLMTADPRIVTAARVISRLNVREAAELAHYGVRVLHPKTLVPLSPRTRLHLRPFQDGSAAGTEISSREIETQSPVKAVVATMDQAIVGVSGRGMFAVPGIVARALTALHQSGIAVGLISQPASEYAVAFTVTSASAGSALAALRSVFARELATGEIESIDARVGVSTLGIVGLGLAREPGVAARVFGALASARINVIAAAQGSGSGGSLSVVIDATRAAEAQSVIHEHFQLHKMGGGRIATVAHADVVLLGAGAIGRELLAQLSERGGSKGARLRVCGVIDRSGYVFDAGGLSRRRLAELCDLKTQGASLAAARGGRPATTLEAVDAITSHALSRPILVDATAAETTGVLELALRRGWDLVLANKVPLAAGQEAARALLDVAERHGRQILHEATVGAGLPVIDTLRKLIEAGDRVMSIEGCPSGTLGYLFGELGSGRSFSAALRSAVASGYTEPDPRVDLSGLDVARKALILGRLIGFEGDLADIAVESMIPAHLAPVSREDFLERLEELDGEWSHRVRAARANGTVLRYRARVTPEEITVGIAAVAATDPLGTLSGTDNQFAFTTARYQRQPLVITGPGAGAAVTAAGVFNDLLRLATERGADHPAALPA